MAVTLMQGMGAGGTLAGPACEEAALELKEVSLLAPPTTEERMLTERMVVAPPMEKPSASQRSERETSDSEERTRIVSYLILRGLQGAGPFLGAR